MWTGTDHAHIYLYPVHFLRVLQQLKVVSLFMSPHFANAGAHRAWFHLYNLLSTIASDIQQSILDLGQAFAVAVEQFIQTATLGEFERRMQMVQTLR